MSFFSSKSAPIPPPIVVPPVEELPPPMPEPQPLVEEAGKKVKEDMKKKRGYSSTILTGPKGDESDPSVLKKKLGD